MTKKRYFIELAYKGTRYHGWQVQPNAVSVQGTLEAALAKLLREPVEAVGCGRTDAGVHAARYVAHFDSAAECVSEDFLYHLNAVLPRDIAVYRIREVDPALHARFSALEREYKYCIATRKDPFAEETALLHTAPLDETAMNLAAEKLYDYDDFTSFAKLHTDVKTNICDVRYAAFGREGDRLVFTIRADRFLRNMVRAIVGSLLEVGKGKMTPEEFAAVIEAKDRGRAGGSAAAHGLFLTDVKYNLDWNENNLFSGGVRRA